ncbi:hypothetical protein BDA99DRAFT_560882 [Phascolomyces articulosus]|uniref:Uncharacterized protein n=1 Tax=Phascolomyces articulosus TaxID=60185 RepID=A0AAD5K7R9_9FUNG|nr:hypothetical protein BDA99DRAFT_560882 [Phascolomyces articulosus]
MLTKSITAIIFCALLVYARLPDEKPGLDKVRINTCICTSAVDPKATGQCCNQAHGVIGDPISGKCQKHYSDYHESGDYYQKHEHEHKYWK